MAGPRDPETEETPESDVEGADLEEQSAQADIEGADLDREEGETVSPDVMSVHRDERSGRTDIERE